MSRVDLGNAAPIVFDENLLAIWFVQISSEQDFMAALSRSGAGKLRAVSRFRYYDGAPRDAWDRHRKSWYAADIEAPEAEAVTKVRTIASMLASSSGAAARGDFYELLRGPLSLDEFLQKLFAAPFANVRPDCKGECA